MHVDSTAWLQISSGYRGSQRTSTKDLWDGVACQLGKADLCITNIYSTSLTSRSSSTGGWRDMALSLYCEVSASQFEILLDLQSVDNPL